MTKLPECRYCGKSFKPKKGAHHRKMCYRKKCIKANDRCIAENKKKNKPLWKQKRAEGYMPEYSKRDGIAQEKDEAMRECLRCHKDFLSKHKGIRFCSKCKEKVDYVRGDQRTDGDYLYMGG